MKFALSQEDDVLAQRKDVKKSITIDEDTHQMALQVMGEVDCSFSELVRMSLCVAAPQLVHSPFMRKITVQDFNVTKINRG